MAQYEAIAVKMPDGKWIEKCNVSYMKQLLVPNSIWMFGHVDGLVVMVHKNIPIQSCVVNSLSSSSSFS
jgi:hypothetical protein